MTTNDKVAVWLDTDIGGDIDDAVCLLMAIRHPQIEQFLNLHSQSALAWPGIRSLSQ